MISLVARYTVRDGERDRVAGWLQEMAERVRRDEPACLTYAVGRSREHPDEYVLFERYPDEDALAAHRRTAHYRELIEERIVPCLSSRTVELLDPTTFVQPADEAG